MSRSTVRRAAGSRGPAIAAVLAAAVLAGALGSSPGLAQPASADELARAKALYETAEDATRAGRFDDAARDYGASYELSRDPALLFKIGRANERAGRCPVAIGYYTRYLRDGQPTPQFVATTRERIVACGGDPASVVPAPTTGSAATGSAATSSAATGSAAAGSAAPAEASAGSATGAAPAPVTTPSNRHKVAWVLTGSAIALVTLGGVLAYAAGSSENDVRDLYAGFNNRPPTFDAETRKRYDDIVAQGRRYQHLSWASFGLAGGAAIGAAILFVTGGQRRASELPRITPVLTPSSAGISLRY